MVVKSFNDCMYLYTNKNNGKSEVKSEIIAYMQLPYNTSMRFVFLRVYI